MTWLRIAYYVLIGGTLAAGVAYALLDIFRPELAIRWQLRSTRRDGLRGHVGRWFGGMLGTTTTDQPWSDRSLQRRVRIIGAVLFVVMLVEGWVFLYLVRP